MGGIAKPDETGLDGLARAGCSPHSLWWRLFRGRFGTYCYPLVIIVAFEAMFTYRWRGPIDAVVHGTEAAFHDLDLFSGVLAAVEAHAFHGARLQELQRELVSGAVQASQAIARLRTLVDFIHSRHNVFVRIIDAPLMYSVQVAFAAERWRKAHGSGVRRWLGVVGEIEALLSLAAYSYEHPDDPIPEFVEGEAIVRCAGARASTFACSGLCSK